MSEKEKLELGIFLLNKISSYTYNEEFSYESFIEHMIYCLHIELDKFNKEV